MSLRARKEDCLRQRSLAASESVKLCYHSSCRTPCPGSSPVRVVESLYAYRHANTTLESDKNALHNDAKRLFTHESDKDAEWKASYDVQYKSWKQSSRHAERDGTAFASVALPSHYAAIVAVLDHVKRRLEPDWTIERVIDWGSGTGTGLWYGKNSAILADFPSHFIPVRASSYSFPKQAYQDDYADADDAQLSRSTVSTYLGIDRREGLVNIGRRLVEGDAYSYTPGQLFITELRS